MQRETPRTFILRSPEVEVVEPWILLVHYAVHDAREYKIQFRVVPRSTWFISALGMYLFTSEPVHLATISTPRPLFTHCTVGPKKTRTTTVHRNTATQVQLEAEAPKKAEMFERR
jgi:hypothetical protein